MKNKIIFFDIDGTLLDHQKRLPNSTKKAVQLLKQAGHVVAIATARSPFMFENLAIELGVNSFVSINGQYVVLEGEVIYSNPLKSEIIHTLKNYADHLQHPLVYADHEKLRSTMDKHVYVDTCFRSLKMSSPVHQPNYYIDRDIFQCILFCTKEDEMLYKNKFPDLHFVRWHEVAMDAIPTGRSKAYGIERCIDRLGFSKEEAYAFGDSYNDIEMLQYVGNGIAMGNAPDAVKDVAKLVTTDVEEDGIFNGLKMLGLL